MQIAVQIDVGWWMRRGVGGSLLHLSLAGHQAPLPATQVVGAEGSAPHKHAGACMLTVSLTSFT